MASGNRSGYGSWEFDKGDVNLDYCDFGLGLKIPWQQQQQQQQEQQRQQQQRQQQQQNSCLVPWLQTRQTQTHNDNDTNCPSPNMSAFPQPSRFGEGGGERVTFTAIQRQELERQTIIYKYMMASMPVPPELLLPLSKYPCSSTSTIKTALSSEVGRKAGVELRYGSNRGGGGGGGDPEPWRCRRTDGKKWRCSRDVAPDQKYCERHSHKGRPSRSRKPVETPSPSPSPSSSILTAATTSLPVTTSSVSSSSSSCNPIIFTPFAIPKPSSHSFDLPSQFNPFPRYPDWFMKKEVAPTAVTASACLYPQQIGGGETRCAVDDHHQSSLLPRPFIDAWSLGDHADPKDATNPIDIENNSLTTHKCHTRSSPLNSILPLTLSMSAGIDHDHLNPEDHAKENPDIRLSSSSSSHHQPLNWMSSWIGSPPGGPLAEALCLGISGTGNGTTASHSDDQLVSPHGHSTASSTTTLG